jgi:uncharacterized membrane protein YqjE
MDSSAPPAAAEQQQAASPPGWSEALATLLSARLTLIQLESQAAGRQAATLAAALAAAALAAVFAWALALAGGIAAVAAASAWPWHWLALAAAVLHALGAVLCLRVARAARPPLFPITRAEFHKDREWLATLKTPRKSND